MKGSFEHHIDNCTNLDTLGGILQITDAYIIIG